MVEVYGALLAGSRDSQFAGRSLARAAMASMSQASASVTTSAGRPSMTERACLPEPPWDCVTRTVWPVSARQWAAKAALYSSKSSRVGS